MAGRYYNRQGGVSRVLAELADRAAAAGHDVDVYTHEALDVDPATRVRFVEVGMQRRPVWRETRSFAHHLDGVLDPAAYDVVHAHDGQARRANVVTAHSCYAAWLHDVRRGAGVKGLASRVYPRHVATERWERATYRDPDPLVIAISSVVASALERFHALAPERVRVIHNGVDVDGFQPPASREAARAALPPAERPADEGMVFLFVGMYFRRKGLHTLLELTDTSYRLIRAAVGARRKFFAHLEALTTYLHFQSWERLMDFMMRALEIGPDAVQKS
jgi:glycosyltransferase involved in cell wall biosynthesis